MELLFLDLETQKSSEEVGGWHNAQEMLVSVVVTHSSADNRFHIYEEDDLSSLFEDLRQADLIVGYNIQDFDYAVLSRYAPYSVENLPTLDMMKVVQAQCRKKVKLDNLAKTTLGTSKTADGLAAIKLFRDGKMHDLVEYCTQDVRITRDLYYYGADHGEVRFKDRGGKVQHIPVDWGRHGR